MNRNEYKICLVQRPQYSWTTLNHQSHWNINCLNTCGFKEMDDLAVRNILSTLDLSSVQPEVPQTAPPAERLGGPVFYLLFYQSVSCGVWAYSQTV